MIYYEKINAAQWTGNNFDELKKEFGSSVMIDFDRSGKAYCKIKGPSDIHLIEVGDFIVKKSNSEVIRMTEREFKSHNYIKK